MNDVKNYIIENNLGKVYEDKSFKDYTTLKIGGKIALVFHPNNIENFVKFYKYYQQLGKKLLIIGNGSNILASDKYYDGVVVNFNEFDIKYILCGNKCTAYPSCPLVRLSNDLAHLGLSGGEFYIGIPATLGGAIYMNAGANGQETKDILESAKLIDHEGNIKEYQNKDLKFSYRKSLLQEKPLVVLEAKLKFENEKVKDQVLNKIRELKKLRKQTQPTDKLSAGCTFQNPKGYYAWELIDKIGFRGYAINEAQVSEKHSNFLLNKGNATSDDMMKLIKLIQEKVKEQFNIDLKCEWILVNFD